MPTRVKICGITRLEDARLAIELGAAALGFNFYLPSPRYIAPVAARALIEKLPPFVTMVGVFADETDAGGVLSQARQAGVTTIQVHGPVFPVLDELSAAFPLTVAVGVGKDFRLEDLRKISASAYLLDSSDPVLRGGTGKTFDWSIARAAKQYGHVILAGGLTPMNVAQAVCEVQPYAVDVASGVESAPGIKDPAKLRAFLAAVAEADRQVVSL